MTGAGIALGGCENDPRTCDYYCESDGCNGNPPLGKLYILP